MDYLGLFCLGAFVGAIGTFALRFVKDISDWRKVLALALPAVLSGVSVIFVDKFKYSPALGCYPLGLLVALLWSFSDTAVQNIVSDRVDRKIIGLAHLIAATALTGLAGLLVIIPVLIQLRDETSRPVGEVLMDYKLQQRCDASQISRLHEEK